MNQILEIRKEVLGEDEVNSISTRELHEFLGSKQEYATWIRKRLKILNAIENEDYVKVIYDKVIINKFFFPKKG